MTAKKATSTSPSKTTVPKGDQNPDSIDLWLKVAKTDPQYTKAFLRGGGFKGTAINATWLIYRATEIFGPMGVNWGVDIVSEDYVTGAPFAWRPQNAPPTVEPIVGNEIVHVVQVRFWYRSAETPRAEIYQYGQTTFVGVNKYGPFTDEEAPKKSLTDATTKALSMLGFSADIRLGLWDDNKYVSDRRAEAQADKAAGKNSPVEKAAPPPAKETPTKTTASASKETIGKRAPRPDTADAWKQWETDLKTALDYLLSAEPPKGQTRISAFQTLKDAQRENVNGCPDRERRKRVVKMFLSTQQTLEPTTSG